MTSQKKPLPKIDYGLILTLMLLTIVSLITIYSAQKTGQYGNRNFVIDQIMWYVISTVAVIVIVQLDSDQMKKIAWYTYGICLLSLIGLYFSPESDFTPIRNGAKSWYVIPKAGAIQPSEFMKVFTIIVLAKITASHNLKFINKTIKTDFWLLIKLGILTAIPAAVILKQPDLGTALVFGCILLAIILVSGISWKILFPLFSSMAVIVGGVLYIAIFQHELLKGILADHQYKRIYSWLDPYSYRSDESFQLVKSLLAVGSGQTTGKGYKHGEVYMPEAHSDFIFSTIGEEFGFIGGSIVISLFFMLIYQITKTGIETKNPFYSYICAGVVAMLAFHVFENIGMTIGLVPITGIPLPFISYGGSALLGNMMAVGIILSIRYHYKKYMFSDD
ncbi:FtsW/RodA/SpoVE family cell cycle protein [Lederbergia wuyishanensis]|uniref:Rod shape determining protein RodA n=1 Tax=Lederbergia wuyishanensis TaxID=1347903 RepID=A0ABU0D995_9BACI|nr:FtsW/RodA/SpoVE family cell cycle protein [Lederbergia wuyishanensis]MCJ8009389.1 rod shape-determining protein RodA [Lederbergia wuyishanensis]MDQ0345002.1 rod shape determining protein RodA [Lederbergia wuyishanensis]